MPPFIGIMLARAMAFGGGGVARALVGSGAVSRGLAYPPAAILSAWLAFGFTWWAVPFAVVPALTMWMGWTKWQNRLWMAARYGLPPAILAAVYVAIEGAGFAMMVWGCAAAASGALYGAIQREFEGVEFRVWKVGVDSSRIAEFIAGTIQIGGVALL